MRPPARRLIAFAAALVAAAACTKISTDATAPVAIELRPPPLPSVVLGDSMRDSTGAVVGLTAIAFNSRNDTIPGAPIRFLTLDTTGVIGLDTARGTIFGRDTGQATVYATAGGLQSTPVTVYVVPAPTTFLPETTLDDTLHYTFNGRDTTLALRVRLLHVEGADSIPVPHYLVRYSIAYPAGISDTDSTQVQVVDDSKRPSLVDTTDATGRVARLFRIAPVARTFSDTVIVLATAVDARGAAVPGSPIRFRLFVTIQ